MAAQTQILDRLAQTLFPTRTEFLSFREAATETTLSERTLRRFHKQGRLSARKVGGRLLIERASLEKLLS